MRARWPLTGNASFFFFLIIQNNFHNFFFFSSFHPFQKIVPLSPFFPAKNRSPFGSDCCNNIFAITMKTFSLYLSRSPHTKSFKSQTKTKWDKKKRQHSWIENNFVFIRNAREREWEIVITWRDNENVMFWVGNVGVFFFNLTVVAKKNDIPIVRRAHNASTIFWI